MRAVKAVADDNLAVFNKSKLLVLKALFECQDDMCGCDLIEKLNLTKSLLSYHLKFLSSLGYVRETRCGRKKNYRINEKTKTKVKKILEVTELI